MKQKLKLTGGDACLDLSANSCFWCMSCFTAAFSVHLFSFNNSSNVNCRREGVGM